MYFEKQSRPALLPSSERALASLWDNARALPDGLVTEDGRRFRVVYSGRSNPRAGPDFLDAVLETESGEFIRGDVEIHLNAPDWHAHRHDVDPNYNGVVLHVVLHPKGRVATSQRSGMQAPVVSLSPHLESLERLEASPIEGLSPLASMDDDSLAAALDRAGDERFLAKAQGFALELERDDPEQVLHAAIMEALGYASNRKPFRRLAYLVPMTTLMSVRREPGSTRLMAIKALLLSASGLANMAQPESEVLALRRIHKNIRKNIHKKLPKTKRMAEGEWNLFRVRPANHPIARIEGASILIDRHIDTGLARGLECAVLGDDPKVLTKRLWARPYIGESRARDIVVNVVLPFMRAYAALRRSDQLRERCAELYKKFPKLSDNEITREMMSLLTLENRNVKVRAARRQQGLIHLYKSVTRPYSSA